METAFVGPGRAGPGLAMQRAETGRALNSIRARGPGRAVRSTGRAGPTKSGPCRPLICVTRVVWNRWTMIDIVLQLFNVSLDYITHSFERYYTFFIFLKNAFSDVLYPYSTCSLHLWFLRYLTSKFYGLTLTLDPKRSPELNNIFTIRKPILDFLSDFYCHFSLLRTVF